MHGLQVSIPGPVQIDLAVSLLMLVLPKLLLLPGFRARLMSGAVAQCTLLAGSGMANRPQVEIQAVR